MIAKIWKQDGMEIDAKSDVRFVGFSADLEND